MWSMGRVAGWLLLTGRACATYSPRLLVWLGHHLLLCYNLLLDQTQDFQTLALVSRLLIAVFPSSAQLRVTFWSTRPFSYPLRSALSRVCLLHVRGAPAEGS